MVHARWGLPGGRGNPLFFEELMDEGLGVQEVFDVWLGWTHEPNRVEPFDAASFRKKVDGLGAARVADHRGDRLLGRGSWQGRARVGGQGRRRVRRGVPGPGSRTSSLLLGADREQDVAAVVQRIGEAIGERRAHAFQERRPRLLTEHLADEPPRRPYGEAVDELVAARNATRTASAPSARAGAPRRAGPPRRRHAV